MALKTETSRESGIRSESEDEGHLETHLLEHNTHVHYNGIADYSPDQVNFRQSACDKVLLFLSTLTIEPLMFLFMYSYIMRGNCFTNLALEKACLNRLNYSAEICGNLSYHEAQKEEVEKVGNLYNQYATVVNLGPAVIAMLFIGPWSDRYGRKPPLIFTLMGTIICDIGVTLNTVYFEAPLEYLLLPGLAEGFTGGYVCILSTMFSLASEVTTERQRTRKYAFVELAMGLGVALGGVTGGMLYNYYSSLTVFIVTTIGHSVALPWALLVIQETRGLDAKVTASWKQKVKDLFSVKQLSEGFKAYIKLRPNHGRVQLWMLLVALCALDVTYTSLSDLSYVYAFHMYGWGPMQYSTANSIFTCTGLVLCVLCIPISVRVFKVGDKALGFIGTLSMAIKNLLIAFATRTWIFYVANVCGLLSGVGLLAVRSRTSKLVEKDELGKVFTFMSSCELLIPLVGTICMTAIYNSTLSTFPGLFYLVAGAALIFPIISFAWMIRLKELPITPAAEVESNLPSIA